MAYRTSFPFSAPAEVVFGVLTDPHRIPRWLAPETGARIDDGVLSFRWPAEAGPTGDGAAELRYRIEPVWDGLRVRWAPLGAGWSGRAEVRESPAGGSEVLVELDVPNGRSAPAEVTRAVEDVLRRLGGEVAENFTAG